jgi:hypothetical protein
MSQPILQYPDFSKEFILSTDASNEGIGAVLAQGQLGRELPLAYASRSLNMMERNYSTSEKELLAIVWSIKHFRPYLYGRKFKITTDHQPLTWIMNVKDPSSRLLRWRIKLEEYDYEILYRKGALNANADALSRINEVKVDKETPLVSELNEEQKKLILYEYHDAPLGGHKDIECNKGPILVDKHEAGNRGLRKKVQKLSDEQNVRCTKKSTYGNHNDRE